MGKGLRFLLNIVINVVVLIAIVVTLASINADSDITMLSILGCFGYIIGSFLLYLAYDTLNNENKDGRSFLQKLLTMIGIIVILVAGLISYICYMQNVSDFSPFFSALAASWLLAGLATILLYKLRDGKNSGFAKLVIPYLSLVVSYIVFVILGFVDKSGWAGLVISILLFVVVVLKFKRYKPRKQISDDYKHKGSAGVLRSQLIKAIGDKWKWGTSRDIAYIKNISVLEKDNTFLVELQVHIDYSDLEDRHGKRPLYSAAENQENVVKHANEIISSIKRSVFDEAEALSKKYSDFDGARIEVQIETV